MQITFNELIHCQPDKDFHQLISNKTPFWVSRIILFYASIRSNKIKVKITQLKLLSIYKVFAVTDNFTVGIGSNATNDSSWIYSGVEFIGLSTKMINKKYIT